MPEGPSIVHLITRLKQFEGREVTKSGGYDNLYAEELSGLSLQQVSRYGKYILLVFENFFITIHLRLFGSFLVNKKKKVNASFFLEFHEDIVNFYVVKAKKWSGKPEAHFQEELDPFSDQFDPKTISKLLIDKAGEKRIGEVLMNQDIFPGVGNVIRNEVLFLAKIHPDSIVKHIPTRTLNNLLKTIQEFSTASVELIEKGVWKSSSSVYQKEEFQGKPVVMYSDKKLKRKTFVAEHLQKLYKKE